MPTRPGTTGPFSFFCGGGGRFEWCWKSETGGGDRDERERAVEEEEALTPQQLKAAGIRMYGRKHWASELSLQLGLVPSTIYRHANLQTENIPAWMEVAVLALLERHKEIVRAEKLAREQRARARHQYRGKLTTLKHPERSKRNPANVRPAAPHTPLQPPVQPPSDDV